MAERYEARLAVQIAAYPAGVSVADIRRYSPPGRPDLAYRVVAGSVTVDACARSFGPTDAPLRAPRVWARG